MSVRPQSGIRNPAGPAGMVGGRPQSGIRPVTGVRPGTGARPGTGSANAAGRVAPQKRNVVNQGLTGMNPIGGPGRQIADKSWFLTELRQRCTELSHEIENLNTEIQKFERGNQESFQVEKKIQLLQPEVGSLQDRLGDYNLLLERIHMSTAALKVDEIQEQVGIFQRKNELESKKINEAFTEFQAKEQEITQTEQRIYDIQQETDRLVNELDPEVRNSYNHKREENMRLVSEINEKQQLLDELSLEAQNLEDQLRRDTAKTKSVQLHDELRALTKEKVALEEETGAQLSVPEEIEKLLYAVKKSNNEIAHIEAETSTVLDAINKIRAKIADFERYKEESKTDRAEKFRELMKKDKEMNKFIKEYDTEKAETAEKIKTLQEQILEKLDVTAKGIKARTDIPTATEARQAQDDLNFKSNQADLSQTTAQKLQQELEHRKQELAKMETLDVKIAEEMTQLAEKSENMKKEMASFGNLDAVRAEFQSGKDALAAEKRFLLKRKELLSQNNGLLANTNDAKERQLRDSDVHSQLELQEKSLRHYMQNNFTSSEYIAQKEKEGDYKSMIQQTLKMVNELNTHHINTKK
eukprot:TRINITY_DN2984_c0_g1_i1.p1 TRINITY_DN2984_c0_g1~~TRINITY_DN2984_c0_g1_i1.p1  ORF type:complete len:583 (-),score=266.64 TRINITY_DN2984_c0_g1_i1:380-2128(-)